MGAVLVSCAVLLGGCSQEKADAIEAAQEIRALCEAGKTDEAERRGAELYEVNPVFKEAVDSSAVSWKIKEIAAYPYCGPNFVEASRKMREHTKSEGCGCHVVGLDAPGPMGGLSLLLVGLAALWRRRRRERLG